MIRNACAQDYQTLNVLRAQISAVHSDARPDRFTPGFPEAHQRRLQTLMDDPARYDVLVSEEDGQLTGYVMVEDVHQEQTTAMPSAHYAHILELGVDESARGHGTGRALMQAAAQRAAQRGCDEVRLEVWQFNGAAIGLYESLGYATDVREMSLKLAGESKEPKNP